MNLLNTIVAIILFLVAIAGCVAVTWLSYIKSESDKTIKKGRPWQKKR